MFLVRETRSQHIGANDGWLSRLAFLVGALALAVAPVNAQVRIIQANIASNVMPLAVNRNGQVLAGYRIGLRLAHVAIDPAIGTETLTSRPGSGLGVTFSAMPACRT